MVDFKEFRLESEEENVKIEFHTVDTVINPEKKSIAVFIVSENFLLSGVTCLSDEDVDSAIVSNKLDLKLEDLENGQIKKYQLFLEFKSNRKIDIFVRDNEEIVIKTFLNLKENA